MRSVDLKPNGQASHVWGDGLESRHGRAHSCDRFVTFFARGEGGGGGGREEGGGRGDVFVVLCC